MSSMVTVSTTSVEMKMPLFLRCLRCFLSKTQRCGASFVEFCGSKVCLVQ